MSNDHSIGITSENPTLDALLYEYAADIEQPGYGVISDQPIPGKRGDQNVMIEYPPRSGNFSTARVTGVNTNRFGHHFMELWFGEDLMGKGVVDELAQRDQMKSDARNLEVALKQFNPDKDIHVRVFEPEEGSAASKAKKMAFLVFVGNPENHNHAMDDVANQVMASLHACRKTMEDEVPFVRNGDTQRITKGDDTPITTLIQNSHPRIGYSEPIRYENGEYIMTTEAPRHLQEHLNSHAIFTYRLAAPNQERLNLKDSTALVLWMKNDDSQSAHDESEMIRNFTNRLSEKYGIPIHVQPFTTKDITDSKTPYALFISTDKKYEDILHEDIHKDLTNARKPKDKSGFDRGE